MAMNLLSNLSLHQLRRAVSIKEQIAALETELGHVFGTSRSLVAMAARRGRRMMSVPARGRISAALKGRWAKRNGPLVTSKKARRKLSAKGRARLSAAARARWVKAKAAGKKSLRG